jgi:SAM-dependent methyltransferase
VTFGRPKRCFRLPNVTFEEAGRPYARPVTFDVAARAYDRFMGRFSEPLAPLFADFAGIRPDQATRNQTVLDVGAGTGALTRCLVERVGTAAVVAVEPSAPFVAALEERFPGLDVRTAPAEDLPLPDRSVDTALAQLVVHFMADPVAGLREMSRVTREGGAVAACVWDHGGGKGPLSLFWQAVRDLDPAARDESRLAGSRAGHLAELFEAAGLRRVASGSLTVRVAFPSFDDWWAPFTEGVGPAGSYVAALDPAGRDRLRAHCAELWAGPPFAITASAWAARGRR